MSVVVGGSAVLVVLMFLFLTFKPVPGAQVGLLANLAASLMVVVFGFLFVTVSSRIVGLIGSSANPISGMTIATLMATSAIFLVEGWTGSGVWSAGHHHRRRGLYRRGECGGHVAGFEDRLSDWGDAAETKHSR